MKFQKSVVFLITLLFAISLTACGAESSKEAKQEPPQEKQGAAPADDRTTEGEKGALETALRYLSVSAFSPNGLVKQLQYEGFTMNEAVYAVNKCGADWNEQALKKAKTYLSVSAFSYRGLTEQLVYEEFHPTQANYAVENCGADWNEQAAKKAQSYLDVSDFTRERLIDQLKYEGFTADQAEYGADAVM